MINDILYSLTRQRLLKYVFIVIFLSGLLLGEKNAYAGYASIVVDANTGKILFQENGDIRNYPASLTKMMTLYLLFEALADGRLTLNQNLPVSEYASGVSAMKLWLKEDQTICVDEAIRAIVTKSANDAAVVAAEAVSGNEYDFSLLMTLKAKDLGMNNSFFYNASGLPHESQVSTAHDMAVLCLALIRDFPQYYHYFSTPLFIYHGRKYKNHNKLLFSCEGVDGLKTGYIKASRYNLAASAVRSNRRIIVVVFGAMSIQARNDRVAELLDQGFLMITQKDPLHPTTSPDSFQQDTKSELHDMKQ